MITTTIEDALQPSPGQVDGIEQRPVVQTLAEALAALQADLPSIDKSKTAEVKNDQGKLMYKYDYADLAVVTEKLYPAMARLGLSFTASPTLNENGVFVLAYSLLHVSGDERSGQYPLPDAKNTKPQTVGSAITYARRYAFCSVVGVVPDEDDDGNLAQQAHSSRSGGKSKPKAETSAPAVKNADPATGEVMHNLTKLMLDAIAGAERQKFMDHVEKEHKVKIGAVPDSKRNVIENLIGEWSAGRPFDGTVS